MRGEMSHESPEWVRNQGSESRRGTSEVRGERREARGDGPESRVRKQGCGIEVKARHGM